MNKYGEYQYCVVSLDWGIHAFPLRGFIPGYGSQETGNFYSASGPMRLVFSLGELLEHVADPNKGFDITHVRTLRIYREGSYVPDSRRVDLFFDNFVAFTPDTTLQIENTEADFDATQRFIYSVNGSDQVTNHVDITFSVPANGVETIPNLPLNGYVITQHPWSWRYEKNKNGKSFWRVELPTRNTTALNDNYHTYQNFRVLGYKDICDDRSVLFQRIIFSQVEPKPKWVTAHNYVTY